MTSKSMKMDSPNRPDEPDWVNGYLGGYKSSRAFQSYKKIAETRTDPNKPIQQSDLLKSLLMDIAENGLETAYNNWPVHPPAVLGGEVRQEFDADVRQEFDADVLIVGAGMAGLVAAYELIRAGVKVKILEKTGRFGGRVHTYTNENSDLDAGLFGEAGAMRLPCKNEPDVDDNYRYKDSTHYLTDFYITKFKLPTQPFINSSDNTLTNIYGLHGYSKEWESAHFSDVWPDWNDTIEENGVKDIKDIDTYYDKTTGVVTDQLRLWLSRESTTEGQSSTWNRWIDIWSQFSLESFLESNWDGIVAKIPDALNREVLEDLKCLLPWPQDAIRGYSVLSYTEQLDQSFVQYLRGQLGNWWSDNMHRIEGGMERLPKAFAESTPEEAAQKALQASITHDYTVSKIAYYYDENDPASNYAVINGYHSDSKDPPSTLTARAVIVATPVNILRQITFESKITTDNNNKTLQEFFKAIEDIFTCASTKIFIQTKTRFWESQGINGGFSKTNLPIGQIHYVTPESDTETTKGLLLIYTWKTEALLFGAMDKDTALKEALEEISVIHPEINEQYEKGIVHAWYDQPSAQGAYGLLKPRQFNNIKTLWYPVGNVFIAGESLSFAAGWIQGALESGMKSAYQFYVRYHEQLTNNN